MGRIMAPFGLRGEVKLFLYNPLSGFLDAERHVVLELAGGVRRRVGLRARAGAGKRIIGTVAGCTSREGADALVDAWVVVDKAALPKLDGDTWYHHELLGLPVRNASGEELGSLAEIQPSGDLDFWVIRGAGAERWVAFRDGSVLEVIPGEGITVADEAVLELG